MASVVSFACVGLPDWVFVVLAHALYAWIRGQGSVPSDGVVILSSAGISSRYTNGVDRTPHEKRSEREGSDSTCISVINYVLFEILRRSSSWRALISPP